MKDEEGENSKPKPPNPKLLRTGHQSEHPDVQGHEADHRRLRGIGNRPPRRRKGTAAVGGRAGRIQRQLETVKTMRSSNFKSGINVPYNLEKVPSASRKATAPRAKHDFDPMIGDSKDAPGSSGGADTAFDFVPNWEEQDVLCEMLRRHGGHCSRFIDAGLAPVRCRDCEFRLAGTSACQPEKPHGADPKITKKSDCIEPGKKVNSQRIYLFASSKRPITSIDNNEATSSRTRVSACGD